MARTALLLFTLVPPLAVGSVAASGCGKDKAEAAAKPAPKPAHVETEAERAAQEERAHEAEIRRAFPLFGLVTGVELAVRKKADPSSIVMGWLRVGSLVHLAPGPIKTAKCRSGWYRIYPKGYACTGEGIEVSDHPEQGAIPPAARDAPLPYAYYYVKEPMVPEYHRLPSRDEQRAAEAFARRYQALVQDKKTRRAKRLMQGKLKNEPTEPAVVARYLDRGFFLAVTGVEVRAFRRFVRTVRGTYVKQARLERRHSPTFHGVVLDDTHTLPIAFALRTFRPMLEHQRKDGTVRMVVDPNAQPIERQTIVTSYAGRTRIGTRIFHELGDGHFARAWFIGVAKPFTPPFKVKGDEPWVHVDLSQQTLVLFRGHQPIYATLVSSGLDGHNTPTGVFTIRRKYVADTMANIGPDASTDDRYRIEDVPWTEYFSGSVALHGAFWHDAFGLQRSHGCVNLSPPDAHYIFNITWPEIPEGWHGVSTDHTGFRGSRVVVTD